MIRKNMELADMATTNLKKVALLTNSQEYKLVTAKSTSTSYKMLKKNR